METFTEYASSIYKNSSRGHDARLNLLPPRISSTTNNYTTSTDLLCSETPNVKSQTQPSLYHL